MDLAQAKVAMDTLWVVVTACLVFFMNAGFATLETGLCQAKNAVNILAKNFIVFAASTLSFWALGWGLMFGDGNGFIGLSGLLFVGTPHRVYRELDTKGKPVIDIWNSLPQGTSVV